MVMFWVWCQNLEIEWDFYQESLVSSFAKLDYLGQIVHILGNIHFISIFKYCTTAITTIIILYKGIESLLQTQCFPLISLQADGVNL